MKRLVTGLLLASVLLVVGVVSASAVSIYQDHNATLLIKTDGSSAWLFVMNAGTTSVNALTVTLYDAATIDLDHSYVYKADGTLVPFTLAAGSPRKYVAGGARTWALSEASGGRIERMWLPASVAPYEYVIVKIDRLDAPIRVYSAEYGNI